MSYLKWIRTLRNPTVFKVVYGYEENFFSSHFVEENILENYVELHPFWDHSLTWNINVVNTDVTVWSVQIICTVKFVQLPTTVLLLFLFVLREGHPVTIQDLLPETGEVLLLEGPPGSGKTSIAHILVSSWTKEPILSLSNAPDLSSVGVFLHVNCSEVKGNLFQEITAQLSLSEKLSAEELQTVLSGSSKSLLLLDGYREGNDSFDESLRRFISERGNCRILVTTCPGQCPTFKQTLGTHRVLSLQIHYAKYWEYTFL